MIGPKRAWNPRFRKKGFRAARSLNALDMLFSPSQSSSEASEALLEEAQGQGHSGEINCSPSQSPRHGSNIFYSCYAYESELALDSKTKP